MKTINKIIRKGTFVGILAVAVFAASCESEEMPAPMQNGTELQDIPTTLEILGDNPEIMNESNSNLKVDTRLPWPQNEFTYLRKALAQTKLTSTVARNELTVFAPTDMAFKNLFTTLGVSGLSEIPADVLTSVLLYHVVPGSVYSTDLSDGYVTSANGASIQVDLSNGVTINSSNVIVANIKAFNGIIHAIDAVMMPPTIVDLAVANDKFSILVQAVSKAGLVETLQSGEFTVFAPTNDAFVALLGELGFNSLDEIPVGLLTEVLLYHVVPSKVFSSDLPAQPLSVQSAQGQSFEIDASMAMIEDARSRTAKLIGFDVAGSNGVIHVIDNVILPNFTAISE